MGQTGNVGFGISSYFGLPNRKRKLLTVEFLTDFKEELIRLDKEYIAKHSTELNINYDEESYMTFYSQVEGTCLFYEALKSSCKKHNLTKAIYEYAIKMPWFDSDCFDDDLVLEMVKKSVIKYDSDNYSYDDYEDEIKAKYKIVRKEKGYNVVRYGSWFEDDKESLENIYNDHNEKVVWID